MNLELGLFIFQTNDPLSQTKTLTPPPPQPQPQPRRGWGIRVQKRQIDVCIPLLLNHLLT